MPRAPLQAAHRVGPVVRSIAGLAFALAAAAAAAQPSDAKALKDTLTGDAKGPAAANPTCRLFTPAEVQRFFGRTVGAGQNAAGGSGCQWSHGDGSGVLVQMTPARYASPPSAMKGYKTLPAVGPQAWVAPDMGWSAGAVDGDVAIVVNVDGPTATEAVAVALLRDTLERRRRR